MAVPTYKSFKAAQSGNCSAEEIYTVLQEMFENRDDILSRIPPVRVIEIARNIKCPLCSDEEFIIYMYYCIKYNLDPLLGYVECVKYDKNKPAQIFLGKRGLLTMAARNPHFVAATTDIHYKNPNVLVASALPSEAGQDTVYTTVNLGTNRAPTMYSSCIVWRNDRDVPTYVTIKASEYNTGNSTWSGKTETMAKKVALTQALEMAFPEDFANGYSPEEFGLKSHEIRTSPTMITESIKGAYANLPEIALPNGIIRPSKKLVEVNPPAEVMDKKPELSAIRKLVDAVRGKNKPENDVITSKDDIDEDSIGDDMLDDEEALYSSEDNDSPFVTQQFESNLDNLEETEEVVEEEKPKPAIKTDGGLF